MRSFRVMALILIAAASPASTIAQGPARGPVDAKTLDDIRALYRRLIEAENAHDLDRVRPIVWDSPDTLFVAKTRTPAEGNWAGFWGKDVVMSHFGELYSGPFRIDPDYPKERVVGLSPDVVETYVPVRITVAYAGQDPIPKPFLMILNWVRTPHGWRMATDIALPIPPVTPAGPAEGRHP